MTDQSNDCDVRQALAREISKASFNGLVAIASDLDEVLLDYSYEPNLVESKTSLAGALAAWADAQLNPSTLPHETPEDAA